MNFLEDNRALILVHRAMPQVETKRPVNVMLTPQFYTLKKERLPIKFAYQAKKIAASLFEGMLQEGRTYDYFVFREEEQWVFIAYSLEEITEFFQSKGLAPESLSKLFFAQQALPSFTEPYPLSEKEVLAVVDDTVVVMPRSLVGDEALSPVSEIPNPAKGIAIQSAYASVLSRNEALGFAAIFLLFAVLFIAEGIRYGGETKAGAEELESLMAANPSLSSQYTRESILTKYRKIDRAERKKRETVKTLIGMLYKDVELKTLHIDEEGFSAEYAVKEANMIGRMESEAQKAKLTVQKSTDGIKVEGRL
ncbi:hypothetical protein [Sulfurovum sp.]|uniref:hypothetical protein n=1 Tax=Sulfurovum sp. TaxID=1969726 RepID=UPI002A35A863|nr:hypothetical protein [Sulfurovum sp.]MDD2451646.1 hypothetical protein [Sulfurovum sp.]MDD3500191.1 hypothetical protein [Sulfurovum sp.]MDY0402872.1 hypothetical protein [Sulfurovum sp.]